MKKKKPSRKVRSQKVGETLKPEIFVKVKAIRHTWRAVDEYKRAYIRVKNGTEQYLQWRENDRVRSLYLGRKRARRAK